ncbi:unnamed protein product [Candidula unifasciata]|uniref:Uncharacterized protein n=1 Tax=Candidula unifasciata TaxID=100452 RepID=A0A8S4A1C6_9EUPU|nr:unnamed protein product [Candidula unifasciata]
MTSTEAINADKSGNMAGQCFVVVKYGDNEEAVLNPCCSTQIFVDSIKRKCHCDSSSMLDLIDLDGQIKNLSVSSEEYASDYVTARETYVAIRVERQGESGPNKYIPLLNNLEQLHPELMVKLNNLSRPGTKNRRDRLKKTQNRTSRTNSNKPESKPRPSSSERTSKSRQGK